MSLKKIGVYFDLVEISAISRRYFVIGFFDGLITIAGMILGAYLAGHNTRELIIPVGFATALALGISSSWGAFEAERIEQKALRYRRERSMLSKLDETIFDEAHRFATAFSSLVHGVSPMLGALILILPYVFLPPFEALECSLVICSISLFVLGAIMGRMADEMPLLNGLRMLILGAVVLILVLLLNPGHVI
ncbi:MAG: VIT1/CCC1 transporter family protein [Archaeoglobaceae archaeon]|nr:VIT1/CCC1 transporter family protein [Archaeoglobaceae archaeon]MDW8118313.1 VIT1/CCC1 transporter family protein [Archaeoglobaceae archaeon]